VRNAAAASTAVTVTSSTSITKKDTTVAVAAAAAAVMPFCASVTLLRAYALAAAAAAARGDVDDESAFVAQAENFLCKLCFMFESHYSCYVCNESLLTCLCTCNECFVLVSFFVTAPLCAQQNKTLRLRYARNKTQQSSR
jgi:hypothetical protein